MGLLSWLGMARDAGKPPEKQPHTDLATGAQKQITPFDLSLLLRDLANEIQQDDTHIGTRVLFDIDQGDGAVIGDHDALKQAIGNLVKYCVAKTPQGYVALTVRRTSPDVRSVSTHFKIEGFQTDWENKLSADVSDKNQDDAEAQQGASLRAARTALIRLGVELETYGLDGKGKSPLLQFRYTCNRDSATSFAAQVKPPEVPARVLIIEPNDFSRRIFKRMSEGLGYETITAVSLIEASQHLAEARSPHSIPWVLMCHADLFSAGHAADWQALAATLQASTALRCYVHFLAFLNRPLGNQATALSTPTTPPWPVNGLSLPSTPLQLSEALGAVLTTRSSPVDTQISAPALSNLRLLVVEDDPINQFLALTLLEGEGAAVQVAGDGQQCLDLLTPTFARFDAVLMDLEMPVLSGLEACKRIRSEPAYASLPLIAVTGHDLDATRTDCLNIGFDECLTKPLDIQTLKETVLRVTRKRRASPPGALSQKQSPPNLACKAILDVDLAVSRMGGDAQIFLALVPQFPQHATELVEQANANLAAGDFKSYARSLHSLKSVSGTMGALALMQACLNAERLASVDGPVAIDCSAALSDVAQSLAATLEHLAQWRQGGLSSLTAALDRGSANE